VSVGHIIRPDYKTVTHCTGIEEVEELLFREKYLVVMDEQGNYSGILIPADIIKHPHKLVIDCLSEKPVVNYTDPFDKVITIMEKHSLHILPVFKKSAFFGVITYNNIINYLNEQKIKSEAYLYKMDRFESLMLMAGGIAHDFSNILTAVFGYLEMMMRSPKINEDLFPILKDMEKGLINAQNLINQLKTFSKEGVLIKKVCSIPDIIKETVIFFTRGNIIKTDFEFPDNLWNVETDNQYISQMISNLTVNAIQAMPSGGIIRVTGENCTLPAGNQIHDVREGKYVKIMFRDTGVGMSHEVSERIFEPYFTTKQGGSGLGLALIYSIMRKHNGYIDVTSEPGKGACFTFYLPALP
jgi:signal transduction histidine kinase